MATKQGEDSPIWIFLTTLPINVAKAYLLQLGTVYIIIYAYKGIIYAKRGIDCNSGVVCEQITHIQSIYRHYFNLNGLLEYLK